MPNQKHITKFMRDNIGSTIETGRTIKINGRYREGTHFDSLPWAVKVEFMNAYLQDFDDEGIECRLDDRAPYHAYLAKPSESAHKALFEAYLDANTPNIIEAYDDALAELEVDFRLYGDAA